MAECQEAREEKEELYDKSLKRSHVTYRGREGGDETKKTQRQKGKADRINVTAGPYL